MRRAKSSTEYARGFFGAAARGGQRQPRRASIARDGWRRPGARQESCTFLLLRELTQRFLCFADFVGGEFAGVNQMGHDGEGAASEETNEIVDHAALHGAA